MVQHFRRRVFDVEAVKFDGSNKKEIHDFCKGFITETPQSIFIEGYDGFIKVNPGSWVIKGVSGDYYSCRPDTFDKSYEPLNGHDVIED